MLLWRIRRNGRRRKRAIVHDQHQKCGIDPADDVGLHVEGVIADRGAGSDDAREVSHSDTPDQSSAVPCRQRLDVKRDKPRAIGAARLPGAAVAANQLTVGGQVAGDYHGLGRATSIGDNYAISADFTPTKLGKLANQRIGGNVEGGSHVLGSIDGDHAERIGIGTGVAPAAEGGASGRRRHGRDDRAIAVGAAGGIEDNRSAARAGGGGGDVVAIEVEGGSDALAAIHHQHTVPCARTVAAPTGEGGASGRRRHGRDDRAVGVDAAGRVEANRSAARAASGGADAVAVYAEGGSDALGAVHGEDAVSQAGAGAAPTGEGGAGVYRSRGRDHRAIEVGAAGRDRG